jgi:hypothetical protein
MRRSLFVAVLVGASLGLLLTFAPPAHAAPTGTTCTGALCQVDATGDLRINTGAATSTSPYEWLPGVAVTTFQGTVLDGAKFLTIDHRGTADCFWEPGNSTMDPTTLTTTGAKGDRIRPGDFLTYGIASDVFLTNARAACTAATSTGAGLFTRQWK